MKILPIDSEGSPVDVVLVERTEASRTVVVFCGGQKHKLSLNKDKEVEIHNHSEKEIAAELTMAELAESPGSACPCVRVKIWLERGI